MKKTLVFFLFSLSLLSTARTNKHNFITTSHYTSKYSLPVSAFITPSVGCAGSALTFTDQSTGSPDSWSWSFPGGTPSSSSSQNPVCFYTVPGTYTIALITSNASGVGTTVTHTFVVNPVPVITVNSATVCATNGATLTAMGATNYYWNTGETTATVFKFQPSTTVYTVTGESLGCFSSSQSSTVIVNSITLVTVSQMQRTVCANSAPAPITGFSPPGGTFSGFGVTGNYFDPSTTGVGTFTVTYHYTNSNNCTDTNEVYFNVNVCTGFIEEELPALKLYPNPVKDILTIDPGIEQEYIITIYDSEGKNVYTAKHLKETVIKTGLFAKGLYFIIVSAGTSQKLTSKFIKEE